MQPTITIPQDWDYPRFSISQRTKQGIILGLEYYPADTLLAHEYGQGWRYTILSDKNSEEIYHYFEDQIQPLSVAEFQAQLQAEIEEYQQRIEALQQQLAAITGDKKDA